MADEIKVKDASKEQVAMELTKMIYSTDQNSGVANREYWFTLYEQSLKVVKGYSAKEVLKINS